MQGTSGRVLGSMLSSQSRQHPSTRKEEEFIQFNTKLKYILVSWGFECCGIALLDRFLMIARLQLTHLRHIILKKKNEIQRSVIVNAPAVFRFTAIANPERHAICAEIFSNARRKRESLSYDEGVPATSRYSRESADYAGEWLVVEIRVLCRALNIPMGLQSFGYSVDDIPALVEGTVQQHRVTKISPRPVGKAELEQLFLESMVSQ